MLLRATVTLLLLKCIYAGYANGMDSGGWQQYSQNAISNWGSNQLNFGSQAQDFSSLGSVGGHGWSQRDEGGWNAGITIGSGGGGWNPHQAQDHHVHAIGVGEHIEVSKPITIPVYKNIGIPLAQPIGIPVTQVTAVGVPQPYPVHVPVYHPVAIPVIKTVATIVEKKVRFPVEKLIPVPVEKPVPIEIEKHIPVPVEKPFPIHVPIYKHVFHRKSHGWSSGWGR